MSETPMERVLQRCSLHALLMLTSRALTRSGFGDVQILDRRHSKQRSRFGGHELMCLSNLGSLPLKVIVKVINDSARLRMMDELAGAVLRTKADLGLLVTPHQTSPIMKKRQAGYGAARIEIVDGPVLASMLAGHGIGVRERGGVDFAFFSSLETVSNRLLNFLAEVNS
jgi:hypothetical protein